MAFSKAVKGAHPCDLTSGKTPPECASGDKNENNQILVREKGTRDEDANMHYE